MNKEREIKDVLKFTFIVFAPILFLMLPVLLMMPFAALISFFMPEKVHVGDSLGTLVWALGLIAYSVFIFIKCFDKYVLSVRLINRLAILTLGWFFQLLPAAFILSNAVGGASMAVADGVAGSYMSRLPQYLVDSLVGAFFGSVVFLPWVIIANFVINKFFSGIFINSKQ